MQYKAPVWLSLSLPGTGWLHPLSIGWTLGTSFLLPIPFCHPGMATFLVIPWGKYGNTTKLHKVLLIPPHSSDSPGDCHLIPSSSSSLAPFLRPLQSSSGPWLSHISPLHSRSTHSPSSPSSSQSSSWSYLKLPALARMESNSSSALAGFPEHPQGSCERF